VLARCVRSTTKPKEGAVSLPHYLFGWFSELSWRW
jgi:hypothetical protein